MASKSSIPRAAYLEDENPETGEALPDTVQSANSAAKRYHSSMRKTAEEALRPGPRDAASDSGYSSHTNVTGASGSSDQPAQTTPSSAPSKTETAPTTKRRQSTTTRPSKRESKVPSPEKKDARSSQTSKRPDATRYGCSDPSCKDQYCQKPRASPEKRPVQPQTIPPLETRYSQHVRTHPSGYHPQISPVLPNAAHYPPGYGMPPPPVTYASAPDTRPRATSRPQSYHAGITPPAYWGMPPVGGFAPPVTREQYAAAYDHSYAQPYVRPSMPLANAAYVSSSPPKTLPSGRPGVSQAMTSETYSTRNIQPTYTASGVGTYDMPTRFKSSDEEDYSARPQPKRRDSYKMPGTYESDSDYSDPDSYRSPRRSERERDRIAMPPPRTSIPSRRPSLKQNLTTSDVVPTRSNSRRDRSRSDARYYYTESPRRRRYEEEGRYEEDRSDYFVDERRRHQRTSSARRPSVETTSSGRTRQTFYSDQPETRVVERSGRRTSYVGREREERQRRQESDAKAHIDSTRGYMMPEVTAETLLKREHRKSVHLGSASRPAIVHHSSGGNTPSVISSGSQRSHKSRRSVNLATHDEEGSRVSHAPDGSVRIRMDAREGTTIEFTGDMDGRTISLKPADQEGGAAELVIGGPRSDRKYVAAGTVRSTGERTTASGASGSGRTSRSRTESEASRGRKHESRRRSGVSEGFYERPM